MIAMEPGLQRARVEGLVAQVRALQRELLVQKEALRLERERAEVAEAFSSRLWEQLCQE